MAVIDLIRNTIADSILMRGGEESDCVYDCFSAHKVKQILEQMQIKASVFTFPFLNTDPLLPDYWCCVTWEQNGELYSFGFNFMSATREAELYQFNEEHNVYGH